MRKKLMLIVFLIVFLTFSFSATLKKVELAQAKNAAKVWLNQQIRSLEKIGIQGVRWQIVSVEEIKEKGITIGYNFNLYPYGHVFFSAYQFLPPVKLYSYSSPIENSNFLPLIKKMYYKMIKEAERLPQKKLEILTKENLTSWKEYIVKKKEDLIVKKTGKLTTVIKGPLLQTKWDQSNPYNKYAPVIEGTKAPAGCVATSFAQIMKYWNYPPKGQGSHSYVTETRQIQLSANFNHSYYWQNMPNSINAFSPSSQVDAISKLLFDVGVAVNMDYDKEASGAYPSYMVKRMPMFFKYSTNIKYDEYYNYKDIHQWFNIIRNEIDAKIPRPVNLAIYSIDDSGHSVVVDGYKIDGANKYFHVNMGWSGRYDGYYRPNNIYIFNKIEYESAIINIYPSELPNAPKPPLGISVTRTTRNFLLYNLYYDIITWKASPTGDSNISEYRVYERSYKGDEFSEIMIAVINVTQPKYIIIPKGIISKKAAYTVTAVGKNGAESIKPNFVIVQ